MAMRWARTLVVVCLHTALSVTVCYSQSWIPIQQPNLANELRVSTALDAVSLGNPVRTTVFESPLYVPNPDRKSYDILLTYNPGNGNSSRVVIMDTGTGVVKSLDVPADINLHLPSWLIGPDGKLYMTVLDKPLHQLLCVYDPARNEFKVTPIALPVDLRGEMHPLTIGTDGKLYAFGTHPTNAVTAAQIDPNAGSVAYYGPIGPSHPASTSAVAYAGAADDRYVYIVSGKVPWYLVAYDKVTGTSNVLLQTDTLNGYMTCSMYNRYGCYAWASGLPGTDGTRKFFWLYGGKAIERLTTNEKPPWSQPAVVDPWITLPTMPEVNVTLMDPDTNGNAQIWYRTPEAKRMAPNPPPANATPRQLGWRAFQYNVPTYPATVRRIVELPDGRLFGTCGNYLGNFMYDPATGRLQHLGRLSLSQYSAVVVGKYVLMSGYPNAALYVYDTTRPWTANAAQANLTLLSETDARSNPRLIGNMTNVCGAHKMYSAAIGADGRIYFGGIWMRDGNAGGFAWYDPATNSMGGFWELFSNYPIDFITATTSGRFIVISTHRADDPLLLKPKPAQGSLFVFDTLTHTIVRQIDPLVLVKGPGPIVGVGPNQVLGWGPVADALGNTIANQSVLYGVDVATGAVAFRKTLPISLPVSIGTNQDEPFDYRLGPDGYVWTYSGTTVLRINPANAVVSPVGKLTSGGRLALSSGTMYVGGLFDLRRVDISSLGGGQTTLNTSPNPKAPPLRRIRTDD